MTPEERTFATTRLRELAERHRSHRRIAEPLAGAVAVLAEVLADVIEDRDDADDPNDRPRCNWHTNGQGWASSYAGTYTDRCVLYEGHAAAGQDADHRTSGPPEASRR